MADEPLRITAEELYTPKVEQYLETHSYLTRETGALGDQPWIIRLIYANWFYLAFWCMVGALAGWGVLEPFFDDNSPDDEVRIAALLMFPVVAGSIGLSLGAAEGIMCRNLARAAISGLVGLGVGFVGGLVALIPTGILFAVMTAIAASMTRNPGPDGVPTGLGLLIFIMGRAMAWAIISIPAGIGQGIALRERKVTLNGLLGAVLGGFIGGLVFDPISFVLTTQDGRATYSRGVGFAVIGISVGLFVGLVEGWTKTAWLHMKKGPLAGKQFVLYKDTTVLGSSPKAEIYLFKDDAIEPRHAVIYNRGGRFEIEDCSTPDGTYVNGIPVSRQILQPGDQIVLGKTVLEFGVREAREA